MKQFNFVGILTALTLGGVSAESFAHGTHTLGGYYFGASLGGSMTDVTQDQAASFSTIGLTTEFNGPNALKADNSPKGALFAGFGKNWHEFYLGLEAFANLSQYTNRNSAEVFSSQVAIGAPGQHQINSFSKLSEVQYGIDLRPGVFLTPNSMFYGRIGASFAELDLNSNYSMRLELLGINSLFISEEKDVVGLRLGAGLEQLICPHLSVRFDYIYTYYGRISAGGTITSDISGTATILTSDTNLKVYNNTVMLGFAYWIC